MTHGQLNALYLPDAAEPWAAAGFAGGGAIRIGETSVVLGATEGAPAMVARVEGVDSLDGLELRSPSASDDDRAERVEAHRNGVVAIDHIVVMTPDGDRTTAAFERQGIEARRVRRIESPGGPRRQTFFWLGDVICEVVGPDDASSDQAAEPARWWGLALTVADIDATKEVLGEGIGEVKPAVQPGRRVATLRRSMGLSVPIMFISPHPKS